MAEVDAAPPDILPTEIDSPEAQDEAPNAETAVATTEPQKKMKKVKKVKKRRPARPQVDPATFKTEAPPQTGTIFNIWYNKWSGGDRDVAQQTAAPNRCNVAKDSGYTRADSINGSYFCLFFARGVCPKGRDCEYLHRLPTLHDLFNPNVDCFGRDKFADYRDDMGGVGSFMRQNRTLYVGRIHVTDDIEEIVSRHFQEWGQIDRTRVLTTRGVAFVTYTNEANAEFAKEAMAHQALDHAEILNVRWATVDPNPAAAKREARMIEERAADAVRKALPPEYVAELEGRDPEAKKRRKIEGSFGLQGYDAPDDVWYAREKAGWEAQHRGVEGSEEHEAVDGAEGQRMIEAPAQEDDGIFSSATIAAMKNRSAAKGVVYAKKSSTTAAPLVGYGSDDDSD
jgi:hypothetical protein